MLIRTASNQQGGALAGGDLPHPLTEQRNAIFSVGNESQMGQRPHHPTGQASELQTAQVCHGIPRTYHRHTSQVLPTERLDRFAAQVGKNVAGDPATSLHRRSGHARQGSFIKGVPVTAEITHRTDFRIIRD